LFFLAESASLPSFSDLFIDLYTEAIFAEIYEEQVCTTAFHHNAKISRQLGNQTLGRWNSLFVITLMLATTKGYTVFAQKLPAKKIQ